MKNILITAAIAIVAVIVAKKVPYIKDWLA